MSQPHPPSPKRGPECPAAAVLEALSAGEPQEERVTHHVDGCAECRGYVDALRTANEAFLKAKPPELFLRQLDRREAAAPKRSTWWRWLIAAVPVAAAAIALVLVPTDDGILLKGGAGFRVAALPSGATEPKLLGPDAHVAAGDSLRFGFESETDGHLLVLERDGTGATSVFWPYNADTSGPVAAHRREFLTGSVELDAAPGPEWLVAIFSPRPIAAGPLLERLRAIEPGEAPAVSCADCTVQTMRLMKGP